MNPLIIGNWKCNPETLEEAKTLISALEQEIIDIDYADVVICPPSIFLSSLIKNEKIMFGSQNCYFENKGAFTGEISVKMIESIGAKYVILGHSERRIIFKETNEEINKKIKKVFESSITPILCIGESREERNKQQTFEVLEEQIYKCLDGIGKDKISKLVLAYEPIWAIGTGNFANAEEIEEASGIIEDILKGKYGNEANDIKIIYGGSVDSKNSKMYLKEMGGLLVGGASLNAEEFLKIIKSVHEDK